MIGRKPYKYQIDLSGKEKQTLRQAKKKGYKNARLVIRILIILLADKGKTIAATADILGCCEQTVLNQRKRFLACCAEGAVAALMDLPRSGRPVTYGPQERAQITAVVCESFSGNASYRSAVSRLLTCSGWCSRKKVWRVSVTVAWGAFCVRTPSSRGAIVTGSSPVTRTLLTAPV